MTDATQWPPRREDLTRAPLETPPYLLAPPTVIPIDVGRQLFVDDFLIEHTTLTRAYHRAEYHPANPIMAPDRPWEQEGGPTAMPFSDGAFYDPQDGLFKLWYLGGYCRSTCYANSRDGVHWEKPALDVVAGTNIVDTHVRDSSTVWLDLEEQDPARRYLMSLWRFGDENVSISLSADGIHWREAARTPRIGDRTTFFHNPFRRKWVYSLRDYAPSWGGRIRRYREHDDLVAGARWSEAEAVPWIGADRLDPPRPDLNTPCELYTLDAVAYESLLLGLFTIWRGQPGDRAKPNDVCLGFSRDGFHWHRPDRRPFLPVSERYGDWNWANVQSVGGGCLVVGDTLYFYVSGRAGVPGTMDSGVSSTGLALLRRDGFASMDADATGGALTTRPVQFTGKHLFVNADAAAGELRAEVLDEHGAVLGPFSRDNCAVVRGNGTRVAVRWHGAKDLSRLAGAPVRLRFYLTSARLYAFWVSPEASGASQGYVAAGGPGFAGPRDVGGGAG